MLVQATGLTNNGRRHLRLDEATLALLTTDYAHHEIHSGNAYSFAYSVQSIGGQTPPADVISVDFTTPDTTKWLHALMHATCEGAARVVLMEAPTGGCENPTGQLTVLNRNRNSPNTSTLVVNYDSTVGTGGLILRDEYIGSGVKSGGDVRGTDEVLLKQNTKYSLWVFSTSLVPASLGMHWYEHTSRT
jgi:hypothetical protein